MCSFNWKGRHLAKAGTQRSRIRHHPPAGNAVPQGYVDRRLRVLVRYGNDNDKAPRAGAGPGQARAEASRARRRRRR